MLSWEKPEFDEFSEPQNYRINVDDHSYQDPLPLETTEHSLKVCRGLVQTTAGATKGGSAIRRMVIFHG